MRVAFDRLLAVLACIVWLAWASTLRDVPLSIALATPVAPPVPASVKDRDGALRVEVLDERGAAVAGATVSIFAMRGDRAYLAGTFPTDEGGALDATSLPRGETWVLVESPGRQRASSRVVVLPEPRTVRLVLRRAERLAVRVIDEDRRPVAGASIEVRGGDPLPFVAKSEADGTAEIRRLGAPPWTVSATAPGFDTATKGSISPANSPLTLTLRSLGALKVTVVDESAHPASGATVLVAGSGVWPARTATTDERGEVRIASLPQGAYDVAASKGDLVSATAIGTAVKRAQTTELRLELGQGRRVTVKVTDGDAPDAPPVKGASVVLAEDGLTSFPREGTTGDDGTIVLGPITDRPATVAARAEGYVPRSIHVPTTLDGPVVVALVRGGTLTGDVVDDRDFPVYGASIEIIGVDFAGMPIDETPELAAFRTQHFRFALAGPPALIPAGELGVMPGPLPHIPPPGAPVVPGGVVLPTEGSPVADAWITDGDGRFRAGPIPPGRVRALVRHPSYVEALSEAVSLAPGGEAHVKVVLRAGATLEGRVVDPSERPVAGAHVEVAATHGTLVRGTLTADDGTFAFAAIPQEVTITVARPESIDTVVVKKPLALKDGERREITLVLPEPRDPVSVRVVDDRNYPLDAAQITATSLSLDEPLRATRFTDPKGVASIDNATGLPLRLEISLPGHAPVVKTFDKAEREITVTLGKGAVVQGDVTTRGGHSFLEGVDVTLYATAGARHAKTDAEGHFVVRDLAAGKARLVLTKKGYARIERTLDVPESDEDHPVQLGSIDMSEAGSIEGVVVDRNDDPVVGARVAVGAVPAYVPIGPLPPGIAVTDGRGRFTLPDVPEGEVDVEALATDRGRGRERGVKVFAGRPTDEVKIRLDEDDRGGEPASAGGVAITIERKHRAIVVTIVAPGSEAERAGLQPNDVILEIDGRVPESLDDARKRLSGPIGDDVLVKLRRDGEEQLVRVPRERVRR